MPKNRFFKNKNGNFIETGCYLGYGIQLALQSGFRNIYSIELSEYYYNLCKRQFTNNKEVKLILGDSFFELEKLLENNPDVSFTYWLDGHYSGGDTARGELEYPIIKELETILKRNVNNEIIYVDDMRILRNFSNSINKEKIFDMIKKYKPHSKIYFEESDYDKEDILVVEY